MREGSVPAAPSSFPPPAICRRRGDRARGTRGSPGVVQALGLGLHSVGGRSRRFRRLAAISSGERRGIGRGHGARRLCARRVDPCALGRGRGCRRRRHGCGRHGAGRCLGASRCRGAAERDRLLSTGAPPPPGLAERCQQLRRGFKRRFERCVHFVQLCRQHLEAEAGGLGSEGSCRPARQPQPFSHPFPCTAESQCHHRHRATPRRHPIERSSPYKKNAHLVGRDRGAEV